MISSREEEFTTNQESSTSYSTEISKASSSSSTTSWSKLKDPRIVRVSRSFGGKDRHSKVYTVRGLRDRRIRLSVHTAIQLYDLQERLGLNQPSKVVDWLLNVAKHEIDTLPPLQFPQGSSFNPMINCPDLLKQTRLNSDHREENWEYQENQGAFVSSNNLLSRHNPSSLNGIFPYNPSDLTLYHPPRNHGLTAQTEDLRDFGLVPLPSTLYQPGIITQSYFHPQTNAVDQELEQKQLHFQSSQLSSNSRFTSATQPIRPFPFNMTANLLPSQNNSGHNKDSESHRG